MVYAENLVDGHRLFPVLLEDLRSASRAIHLSIFLFFDDPIGEEVSRILEEKARAGVQVRVLLNVEKTDMADPFRTGEEEMMEEDPDFARDPTDVSEMRKRMEEAGVQVLDTELDYDEVVETGDPQIDELGREIRDSVRIDDLHVDHRKVIAIDGRVGYCGSANFGAQYQHRIGLDPAVSDRDEADRAREEGRPEPWWRWHDGLVRFEGEIVPKLDEVFRERWLLGGGEDFRPLPAVTPIEPRGVRLDAWRIVKNEPSSRPNAIRAAFLERIEAAERSIFIENPYVYHPAIVAALIAARERHPDLDVTLIVPAPEWNDNAYAQDAQQYHYPALIEAGIAVHEYQNHFPHLKLATFDSRWSIIGSSNLNFRSLEDDKDFELCVVIESEAFARGIEWEVQRADLPWTERITEDHVRGWRPRALRIRFRDPRTLLMIAAREL